MASRVQALWNHPAGPKTVFFWAPMMKWGLVAAGASEMNRPVEKVSVPQSLALACTGIIWTRWSFVITPVNWNLAAANVFVGCTGLYQLQRVWRAKPADAAPADGLAVALEPPPPAAGQPPAPPPAVSA
eukprot:TRINITY_DN1635_c0_g1_i10.p2 TRINITY_DN1635_c0_g1~~TRINITY_DN1635_c0_g1_i10.p2  ORF type:complete len:129 (+),score=31.90 TRINITY_DN1635_c0_g1_i10:132-518(+)